MDLIGGLVAVGKAAAFPVAAVVSFVWIMTKWDQWGTAKGLAAVLAWVGVCLWVAL